MSADGLVICHTQPIDVLGGMLGGVAVLNFYITVDGDRLPLATPNPLDMRFFACTPLTS